MNLYINFKSNYFKIVIYVNIGFSDLKNNMSNNLFWWYGSMKINNFTIL